MADSAGHSFLSIFEWDVDFNTFVTVLPTGKDTSAFRLQRYTYDEAYISIVRYRAFVSLTRQPSGCLVRKDATKPRKPGFYRPKSAVVTTPSVFRSSMPIQATAPPRNSSRDTLPSWSVSLF